jgi:U3 small nucleolar ribonucleoprotein component
MLNPKPWQLTGEIEGQKRPENSLLEEYLQYDRTTRLRMYQNRSFLSNQLVLL